MQPSCNKLAVIVSIALSAALLTGCATRIRQPAAAPQPVKVKLSTFKSVGLKTVVVNPKFAGAATNEKARKKINELLVTKMKFAIPELKQIDEVVKPDAADKPALVIEPVIEEIKFIGGAARFWVGAMAGSSAVLMKVTYTSSATGEVLAAPEFYKVGNAMAGGGSMGASDNLMLDEVVREIVDYTKLNM